MSRIPQGDAPLLLDHETCLGRLRLALLDLTKIGQWRHGADALLAELARRVRQQQFAYPFVSKTLSDCSSIVGLIIARGPPGSNLAEARKTAWLLNSWSPSRGIARRPRARNRRRRDDGDGDAFGLARGTVADGTLHALPDHATPETGPPDAPVCRIGRAGSGVIPAPRQDARPASCHFARAVSSRISRPALHPRTPALAANEASPRVGPGTSLRLAEAYREEVQ